MKPIEIWFAVGSTYTWLAVHRVHQLVQMQALQVSWHPYSTRVIMADLGTLPKNAPVKLRYMWRDIERRATRLGQPCTLPAPYPLKAYDLANQIAVLSAQEGWCLDYLVTTYGLWMEQGQLPGEDPNLSATCAKLGLATGDVLARAQASETSAAFKANTDQARELGIFGAPTFRVDGELFWGEDRLDDALDWAAYGQLMPKG